MLEDWLVGLCYDLRPHLHIGFGWNRVFEARESEAPVSMYYRSFKLLRESKKDISS